MDLTLGAPYRVLLEGDDVALMVFSAGAYGEVLVGVGHHAPDLRVVQDGWGTFFKTQPDEPQDYTLYVWRDGHPLRQVNIAGEPFNITDAQPLGEGYLLSCPRCRREPDEEVEHNGRIYDRAGRLVSEIVLSDGINCMLVTRDAEIWVGYSDEGIFGNFGWDEPLGKSGLVKWNHRGEMLYEHAPPDEASAICDCYAMNVDALGELWCYYYDAFRIMCIRNNGRVQQWDCEVSSAHTMAVAWPYAVLLGDGEDDFACQLVKLEDRGRSRIVRRFTLRTPQGHPITHGRVAAYGSRLHILHERHVYSMDVSDCVAQAT
jgi:hypothetical protein